MARFQKLLKMNESAASISPSGESFQFNFKVSNYFKMDLKSAFATLTARTTRTKAATTVRTTTTTSTTIATNIVLIIVIGSKRSSSS